MLVVLGRVKRYFFDGAVHLGWEPGLLFERSYAVAFCGRRTHRPRSKTIMSRKRGVTCLECLAAS